MSVNQLIIGLYSCFYAWLFYGFSKDKPKIFQVLEFEKTKPLYKGIFLVKLSFLFYKYSFYINLFLHDMKAQQHPITHDATWMEQSKSNWGIHMYD